MIDNTLNAANPVISNYGDFYVLINQLNLMISHTESTDLLDASTKNYYLGEAYGLRAYVYFHLLRSWGDVVLQLDYTNGNSIDIGNPSKAASSAADVMTQIKKISKVQKMPLVMTILSNTANAIGQKQPQ